MSFAIDKRAYDRADQERFAELSGDRNPLHLDPVLARREIFGGVVVHGLHLLLRALDALVETRGAAIPVHLWGSFPNPTFLGEQVTTNLVASGDESRVSAESGGLVRLQTTVTWAAASPSAAVDAIPGPPSCPVPAPRITSIDALAGRTGHLDLWLDASASQRQFPRLHGLLGTARMAELLALTRLIGMECPGLHSIFSAFDLRLTAGAPMARELLFEVERVVANASFVRVRVTGGGLAGVLDTFLRPPPQTQSTFAEARALVSPGEFTRQQALVVGGSRGLGEATAKLVAAGGGTAIVTYHAGGEDAERVAAEIVSAGGRCDVLRCDVSAPEGLARALVDRGVRPTHLYYFASPKIFVKRHGPYDRALYARFAAVYVDGFEALVETCRTAATAPLRIFVPSTTALDEPVRNLEEYADAKAAAEACCAQLARHADVEVIVRRLPRVATDQTLSLVRHPARNALDVMTAIVREMNGRHG